jgi:diaminohydroxyphosphoribosylaminopyrimidine deaminase/5-amino-6-(5-phosphoribosylamino)uracil reductase
MARCLELAKLGTGNVAPNPMVGSVIVYENKIIGEGYHMAYGKAHAEVNAINNVKDKSLLSKATLYVNLEPCAHFGKTPPCANLIIENNIKQVVIGCIDPFAEVAGKGIEKLKNAGIDVVLNVLQEASLELNRRFFTFHKLKRPYIILKWAQSLNGFMDIERSNNETGIHWISQPETKSLVHKWRAEEASILVGRKTIEVDNPQLTCRAYVGNNPVRLIIDGHLNLDIASKEVANEDAQTYVFNSVKSLDGYPVTYTKLDPFNLESILHKIYELDLQSVIIEGGYATLQSFIDAGLWDEARIITGVSNIASGQAAPILHGKVIASYAFGQDSVTVIQPF